MRCEVPGCPMRLRWFVLALTWRCPEHEHRHATDERLVRLSAACRATAGRKVKAAGWGARRSRNGWRAAA